MAKIGFIGIGHMGKPISQKLVDAGHEVSVFDINRGKCESVRGAIVADSPNSVAKGKEYLFTMLPYTDNTMEVIIGENGAIKSASRNCVFIDCGTGSPSLTWFLARRIKEDGFEFLDCPLSGSVKPAEEGELILLGSGNKKAFENSKDVFEPFAKKVHFIGEENGLGQLTKLTLNSMLGPGMLVLSEAINFGIKTGLDKEKLIEVFNDSALIAPFMKQKLENIKNEEFGSDFQTYLMDKDLTYINEVAQHVLAPMPMNAQAWQYFRVALSEGLEEDDYSSVYQVMKQFSQGFEENRKAA